MAAAPTGTSRKRRTYAPRVPPEQRRTELLDAALHLVVTEGHNAATMDSVAVRAGVTKPVVYGQFTSRAELLAALLEREQEQAMRQLLAIFPGDLDQRLDVDPGDLLGGVLEDFLGAVQEAPSRWYCVVMPLPDMPAEFHTTRERARTLALADAERVVRWVLRGIDAPAELEAEIVTHTVLTLFEMAARLVLTDPEHFRPDRFVTAMRAAIGLVSG